jgi:hypothetical protein
MEQSYRKDMLKACLEMDEVISKWREGSTIFEVKGGILARNMGIDH